MNTRKHDGRRTPRRGRGDEGASLVEFALISVLLFTLLFGTINYGFLMSFRGSMQQAASEGARAGSVAPRNLSGAIGGRDNSVVLSRSNSARDKGLKGYSKTCGVGGVTCTTTIADCANMNLPVPTDTAALPDCIRVKITFDNAGHPYPFTLPLISKLLPGTLTVSSTEELNDR